jgi:AP-1 complex subunit mu
MSAVEKFPILLSEAEEESSAVPPCFSDEGINVCFSGNPRNRLLILSSTSTSAITISTS